MGGTRTLGRIAVVLGVASGIWGTVSFHTSSSRTDQRVEQLRKKMNGTLADLAEAQKMTGDMMRGAAGPGADAPDKNRAVMLIFAGIASGFVGIFLIKTARE
jgi:hypothetical protein